MKPLHLLVLANNPQPVSYTPSRPSPLWRQHACQACFTVAWNNNTRVLPVSPTAANCSTTCPQGFPHMICTPQHTQAGQPTPLPVTIPQGHAEPKKKFHS